MNPQLQTISDAIQNSVNITESEKELLIKSVKDAAKSQSMAQFKLERLEKDKQTLTVMLEENIEDLEKKSRAIEAQNRDLEIEASLERVRTVAMGMKQPTDMLDVCRIISTQLQSLNVNNIRNIQTAIFYESKGIYLNYEYFSLYDKTVITEVEYDLQPDVKAFVNQMLQDPEAFFTTSFEGDKLKEWVKYQKKVNQFVDPKLQEATSLHYYFYSIGPGALGISTYAPLSEEHNNVFKRFRNVFELAYRRFIDIEKAIAQAKEAQIELGLERVRARAMAMQSSNELSELVDTVFKELTKLDFALTWCIINIIDESSLTNTVWAANPDIDKAPESYYMKFEDYPFHHAMMKGWKERKTKYVYVLEGLEKKVYDEYLFNETEFRKVPEAAQAASRAIEKYVCSFSFSNFGGLQTVGDVPLSDANLDILSRFGKVFDLTYTRFNDLKQAEAQAREAKIEAALERTRTQSMLMQHSNELDITSRVFHEQLLLLGIESEFSYVWLPDVEKEKHLFWATWNEEPAYRTGRQNGSNVLQSKSATYDLDRTEPYTAECFNAWASGEPVHLYPVAPAEVKQFFDIWSEIMGDAKKLKPEFFPEGLYYAEAFMKYGCFGIYIRRLLTEDEKKILLRFTIEFERTYTRFLDLQKAEAQAREAKIEAGLERVRSRAMAIRKSDELVEVIHIIFQELNRLGFDLIECSIATYDTNPRDLIYWSAGTYGSALPSSVKLQYIDHPLLVELFKDFESGIQYRSGEYSGELLKSWWDRIFAETDFKYAPKDFIESWKKIKQVFYSQAAMNHGFLEFLGGAPLPDDKVQILKRFTNVVDLTYTRYDDVIKAEAQTREANIETALEKVRSRTMGMQRSEELGDVATVLFKELNQLVENLWTCGFVLCERNRAEDEWWLSTETGFIPAFYLPNTGDATHENIYNGWKNGEAYHTEQLENEALKEHYEWLMKIPVSRKIFEEMLATGFSLPTWQKLHCAYFSQGYLVMITQVPCPEEIIFKRFAQVFDQTYTRFLDLQKAEAQAREAQIEASLERVRSKAMAMQKSEDLANAVATVFGELDKLDLGMLRCGIGILDKENRSADVWTTTKSDNNTIVQVSGDESIDIHPLLQGAFDAWLKKQEEYAYVLKGEDLNDYYKALTGVNFKLPDSQSLVSGTEGMEQYYYNATFPAGGLFAFRETAFPDEAKTVMKRFADVFNLTYTRFNDLKQAEAQAKEARIEVALERVRSRTLAMQKSDELAETAAVVFKELIHLGIAPNRLYIGIIKDDSGDIELWATDEDGSKVNTQFTGNISRNATIKKMYDAWAAQKKSITIDMKGKELSDYFYYLSEELKVPFQLGLSQKRRVQSVAYFSKGFIGIASPEPQPDETINLLERFASVFNLTYTRFNDLQVAEHHAEQAELDLIKLQTEKKIAQDALKELKATQTQLIQSEKMASLGELTAGIAHEIQNPLNFVNNFSEVNTELIEEMKEEIDKGNLDDAKAIANDIKDNEQKINHHGKRADAIVKGMLQHSRSSSAIKEPTDINKLADEYLRLAYHGLRAKDKSFNATMKTDYDEGIGKINVIPQDIGRVILNLITNAFYAVSERKNAPQPPPAGGGVEYEPVVTVTTKRLGSPPTGGDGGKVEIRVADNGNGIPQKVLDKIFQPFFTTKPTGQGTGLGLSLSYDIIKAHGGEIKVETQSADEAGKEGEGSEFIIQLPVV